MKQLEIKHLEEINGGDAIDGFCAGVAIGDAVYAVGALTNFWNPVGWVSWTLIGVSVACAAYVLS